MNVETPLNQEVQVASINFKALIDSNQTIIPEINLKGQLCIPEYQRPYVWRERQINRLLSDLIEYHNNCDEEKPMYYLGSIIIHNDNGKLKIIDGQQRITTLLLLKKLKNQDFKSGIVYNSNTSIENIQFNLSYLRSICQQDIFEFRDTNILECIDFEKINITLVVTQTEDLAYTFFETQNTGGVRLNGSDIIKAHHLRAIPSKKLVNYQARKWETIESENVEQIIQKLTKIRFWDNRKWRQFPFYRDERSIKEVLIDEYTIRTDNNIEDISYYYSAVKKQNGRNLQMHESAYKQLKQPLSNGNNTLDYINDYIYLHDILFQEKNNDHRIDDNFFEFRTALLHGHNGTIFLKELMQIAIIGYVSRFGFYRLCEASLWLYRMVYSLRVSSSRNVREDSIFKFVFDNQFIDNILEVYTPDELFLYLKKFTYNFNTDNTKPNQAKDKHIKSIQTYFQGVESIDKLTANPKEFDKQFINAISEKIKTYAK